MTRGSERNPFGDAAIEEYSPDRISRTPRQGSRAYFDALLSLKLDAVRECPVRDRVLDLCCANGEHLLNLADGIGTGVGLDFSVPYLERAQSEKRARSARSVHFAGGDARALPFRSGSFDVVYSFSSLYCVPEVGQVLREIARVLSRSGRCVIELGNSGSLNAVVSKAYPELARTYYIGVSRMKSELREAGLVTVSHRSFQILPYWGERPEWLAPALWDGWRKLFEKQIEGRMLDEWVCSMPGLRCLAFRHLFVCTKA